MRAIKILHWPTSYPDPSRDKPYNCIFVKEHIQSVAPYCKSRVLYIPAEEPAEGKIAELNRTVEDGILTDRIYFKKLRPLWVTNVYIRIVLFFYFLKMIFIERFYPDIVHVHFHQAGLLAILFCKVFRIKMVVTEHWSAFLGWPELPIPRFRKAARVFEFAKWVFTVSDKIKKGIEERCRIDLNDKTSITLNSVDTDIFSLEKSNELSNGKIKKILVVARLAEEKDLPVLFQALHQLQHKRAGIKCEIIGSGDPGQYRKQLKALGLTDSVLFLGAMPKPDIAQRMKTSDALVISSFIENSPCVIGEALCSGLPVVSTEVGGIPELLDKTNGILVPPRNPEALAKALEIALWEKSFDKETISQNAQQRFSFSAIGKQLFTVYQKVTS